MYQKLAKVLVDYSLEIKANDLVWMTGDLSGMALLEKIYEQLIEKRARVMSSLSVSKWDNFFLNHGTDKQLSQTSDMQLWAVKNCDKRIKILAYENTRAFSSIDPKKMTLLSQAMQPVLRETMDRASQGELDWVLSLCPTHASAQEANMGLSQYEEFVWRACFLDCEDPVGKWKALEEQQERVVAYLETKKELHFKTSLGTDLLVNIEGMKWKNSCGKRNFPDGEVFTGPNLKSQDGGVNGVVRYTFPAIMNHTLVEDVTLEFKGGEVVSAKAKKNESFLKTMIAQDEGAKRMGEIAIGTNYQIKTFTQNILFDEKIGGTFHAALGAGYPETGNTNQSALHWDMICDLSEGGEIFADGELISKNGVFVFDSWPRKT